MMYLTGVTRDHDEPALIAAGVGLMIQPGNSYHRRSDRYAFHAIDIGMKWSEADPYLDWLDQRDRERCLFAVSPDAYPDAVESLRRGLEYAPLIRAMGFPAAVVAQDGAEKLTWPWDDLDVLFVGGERQARPSDEWKISGAAERLVHQARKAGKWVHMGRVNGGDGVGSRLERAAQMGCNSADGTFLKYRRRKRKGESDTERDKRGVPEIVRWLSFLDRNPRLFSFETPSLPVHRAAAVRASGGQGDTSS